MSNGNGNDGKITEGLWLKRSKKDDSIYYNGSLSLDGREYWINVFKNKWKKEDKHPDLNMVLTLKEQQPAQQQMREDAPRNDDDIPF